jgi:hypothetical protein
LGDVLNLQFCSMSVHIGEKIKQRAKQLRIGPTELGKRINTSKQNITGIYKRKSIDSTLLKELSKALDFNFFQYYTPESLSVAGESEAVYNSAKDKQIKRLSQQIAVLKKQKDQLKKQATEQEIAYLKKINELLEKSGNR